MLNYNLLGGSSGRSPLLGQASGLGMDMSLGSQLNPTSAQQMMTTIPGMDDYTKNLASTRVEPKAPGGLGGLSTQAIGAIGGGVLQGWSAIQNAKLLPKNQQAGATADGVVGGVSSALSALGPWGMVAGTALKLVNGVGGSLMNNNATAKAAKAFTVNDQVQQSSGYGGVATGATDAKSDGTAYRKSGLFGKLFTNTGNLQGEMKTSNTMQTGAANILSQNKLAMDGAASSAQMGQNNLIQKNYNSQMWNNGSVTYGQDGMKIEQAGSTDTKTVDFQKLGKAAKTFNRGKIRDLKKNVERKQQGGLLKQKVSYDLWKEMLPDRLKNSHDYDLKGYYDKHGSQPITGDMHLTDEFKLPNHVTFSNESVYSDDIKKGGQWTQEGAKWKFTPSQWNIQNVGLDSLQKYFKENEPDAILDIPKHQDGGTINVIADGKLHAHKHELKDHPDFEDADITLKGIPVVSFEGDDVKQHAEVEKNELILHLDISKLLEELMKEGSDDSALAAGKLLAKEIVKNTRDSKDKILKNA